MQHHFHHDVFVSFSDLFYLACFAWGYLSLVFSCSTWLLMLCDNYPGANQHLLRSLGADAQAAAWNKRKIKWYDMSERCHADSKRRPMKHEHFVSTTHMVNSSRWWSNDHVPESKVNLSHAFGRLLFEAVARRVEHVAGRARVHKFRRMMLTCEGIKFQELNKIMTWMTWVFSDVQSLQVKVFVWDCSFLGAWTPQCWQLWQRRWKLLTLLDRWVKSSKTKSNIIMYVSMYHQLTSTEFPTAFTCFCRRCLKRRLSWSM